VSPPVVSAGGSVGAGSVGGCAGVPSASVGAVDGSVDGSVAVEPAAGSLPVLGSVGVVVVLSPMTTVLSACATPA
jgi:hypothetical protein